MGRGGAGGGGSGLDCLASKIGGKLFWQFNKLTKIENRYVLLIFFYGRFTT